MEYMVTQFIDKLQGLSSETDRNYEKQLTQIAEICSSLEWENVMLSMIADKHQHAYEAFFVLCTIYRRNKDFIKLGDILRKNYLFENHPSFNHLLVMYQIHSEALYDYDDLLHIAYTDAVNYNKNSGYLNTFANAYATICENCNESDKEVIIGRWYSLAIQTIDIAINLDPKYAKFYCTKGRVLATKRNYNVALSMVQKAISMENSNRPDYSLIISNYQYYRLMMVCDKQKYEVLEKIRSLENRIDSIVVTSDKDGDLYIKPKAYNGKGSYAFVSYAHQDSEVVLSVIHTMNSLSMNIWYDEGIVPGEDWSESLGEKIQNCSVFFLMLTNSSLNSLNVRKEINLAISMEKKIIAIFLENLELTPGMRLQLELTQMINRNTLSSSEFKMKLRKIKI